MTLYKYLEYDKQGNWILMTKKKMNGQKNIVNRKVEYYK